MGVSELFVARNKNIAITPGWLSQFSISKLVKEKKFRNAARTVQKFTALW
jgi:hypothetical protein